MSEASDRGMSEGERLLWRMLRTKKFGSAKFRRDVPVGPFRVAFACDGAPVIVEVDDSATTGVPRDAERDQWLFCHGYRVLLFRAADIAASPDGVLSIIETEVQAAPRRTSRTVVPLRDGEGA